MAPVDFSNTGTGDADDGSDTLVPLVLPVLSDCALNAGTTIGSAIVAGVVVVVDVVVVVGGDCTFVVAECTNFGS